MSSQLTFDDSRFDEVHIRSVQRKLSEQGLSRIAISKSFDSHPVVKYVRDLPVESASYPANTCLRFQRGYTPLGGSVRNRWIPSDRREEALSIADAMEESVRDFAVGWTDSEFGLFDLGDVQLPRSVPEDRKMELSRLADAMLESVDTFVQDNPWDGLVPAGGSDSYRLLDPDDGYIRWEMPFHVTPEDNRCGVVSTNGNLRFVSCGQDYDHGNFKAKRFHCWSLYCENCANDTALRNGVEFEKQIRVFEALEQKNGHNPGMIRHVVVSPPQEWAKGEVQTRRGYSNLVDYIESQLTNIGAVAGLMVFHPWRQKIDRWVFSPHFHVILYGYLDVQQFLDDNPGWLIKVIHAREEIRSVRHTIAYLETHAGLPLAERDPDEVDWANLCWSEMLAAFTSDFSVSDVNLKTGQKLSMDEFGQRLIDRCFLNRHEEDYYDDRGTAVGDLSGIDWLAATMRSCVHRFRIRKFGGFAVKRYRKLDVWREYRVRRCERCGSLLRVYEGFRDPIGEFARYVSEDPIMVLADQYHLVKDFVQHYKADMMAVGIDILDFSRMIPQAVCTIDLFESDDVRYRLFESDDSIIQRALSRCRA